jgi:hypothetical protein
VVVVLTGIIEEAGIFAKRPLHHVFERFAFQTAAFQKLVAVIDIRLVVLVMVILERLAGYIGCEGVMGIRQVGQGKRHYVLLDPQTINAK